MQRSAIDEYKIYVNEISGTNAILTRLNSLTNHSRDLQKAETILESKITSSFRKFAFNGQLVGRGVRCIPAINVYTMVVDVFVLFIAAFDAGTTRSNQQRDLDVKIIWFLPLVSITAAFIITCAKYATRDARNNGKFNFDYEMANPLSITETAEIQNTLASIEYKGSINIAATGQEMRSASKFLADARKSIDAKKNYLELRKNSLFSVLPNIPEGIKAIVLEYAIDPKNDYDSKVLTFGVN